MNHIHVFTSCEWCACRRQAGRGCMMLWAGSCWESLCLGSVSYFDMYHLNIAVDQLLFMTTGGGLFWQYNELPKSYSGQRVQEDDRGSQYPRSQSNQASVGIGLHGSDKPV